MHIYSIDDYCFAVAIVAVVACFRCLIVYMRFDIRSLFVAAAVFVFFRLDFTCSLSQD